MHVYTPIDWFSHDRKIRTDRSAWPGQGRCRKVGISSDDPIVTNLLVELEQLRQHRHQRRPEPVVFLLKELQHDSFDVVNIWGRCIGATCWQ